MKAVKMLFRWREREFGDERWNPETTFWYDTSTTNPRDYLSLEERKRIREAVLEYGSIPYSERGEREEPKQCRSR